MRRLVTGKNILIGTFICACIHVFRVYLRGYIEDPDIGAFILMSQSFWSGDILYDQFFDPKLPHVLPIYSLSLLSGSIGGHLIITLLCICVTGVVINLAGKNVWGGVLYVCLVLLSPGGVTGHLAVFANFLIACSYYCLRRCRSFAITPLYKKAALGWLIASSVLAGWAIGMRPNYGFALIPLSIWFIWQQKLHVQRAIIWLICCFITILAPVLAILKQADLDLLTLIAMFRSWNSYFYIDSGIYESLEKIVQMYMHPIGPFNLGFLVGFVYLAVFITARRDALKRAAPFTFALAFLWLSHFLSHTYNHYILMDLMIISLLVSSLKLKTASVMICAVVGLLWISLLFSPRNPHSYVDSIIIENQRKILSWISDAGSTQVVSPMWLTPHWVFRARVPTKGIHPEWSIGLLDRYEFKGLKVAKQFGLDVDWNSQCNAWENNASIFIGTQEIYERCKFHAFKEVDQFKGYPLKVWIK